MSSQSLVQTQAPAQATHTPAVPAAKPPAPLHELSPELPDVAVQLERAARFGHKAGIAVYSGSPPVIQAKLRLGPVGDKYEQEADHVANTVVQRMAAPAEPLIQREAAEEKKDEEKVQANSLLQRQADEEESAQAKSLIQREPAEEKKDEEKVQASSVLQRQAEEEESAQAKPLIQREAAEKKDEEKVQASSVLQRQAEEDESAQAKPLIQREPAEEKKDEEKVQASSLLQRQVPNDKKEDDQNKGLQAKISIQRHLDARRKASSPTAASGFVAPHLEASIAGARGSGETLPGGALARMENGFGADFGRVRIHTDARADTLNHSLNARAFTTGHDIFFRSGEYSPDSTPGQTLLAHELTHVLQQSGNERALQRLRQPGGQETPGSLIQPKRLPRHGPALRAASKKAPSEHSLVTLHPHAPVLRRQVMAPAVPELAAPEIAAPPTKFEKAAAETAAAAAEHEAEKTAATSTAALEQMASRPEAPKAVPAVPAVPPVNGVPGPAAEPPTGAAVEAPVESRQAPGQAEATGEAVGSAGTVTAPQAAAPPAQAGAVAAAEAGKPTLGGAPQLPQITASVPARGEAGAAPAAPTQGAGAPAPVAAAAVAKAPEQKAPASPAEDPAFQAVVGKVKSTAARERKHAPAKAKAQEAQSAAVSPPSEISGKAQGGQAVKIAAAPTPAFDAVAFKAQLMKRITELAPKTLQQADDFKEDHKLEGLKGDMQGQVAAGRQAAQGPIAQETARTPDTSSVEPKPVTPLPPAQPGPEPAGVSAGQAAPKPKTSGEVEAPFQAQSAGLDQQMAAGGVTEEQLASANEPEFAGALEAKQEAQADAAAAPQQYRQAEKAQLGQARADSKQAAGQQLRTMHGSRSERVKAVQSRQEAAKQKDEQARAEVGQEIGKIYAETKSTVEGILNDLDGKVGKAFDEGAAGAKESFEGYVDARMKAYKDERYDVIGGSLLWATDKVFGMPSEVNAFYVEGRDRYLKQMDGVIDHVVAIIGTELTRAKDEVAKGREKIQAYLAKQPASLRKVGEEAARNIQDQFADLERSIDDKQGRLIDTLANKYNTNVKAIDDRIEQLKEANKGLASKAWDAVGGVINTIRELKNMLLDTLSRAAAAIGKIILHPIDFLGNLIDGVKLGMSNFVEKLDVNLQQGLIEWLTGAITGAGIQLPEKWDLPGIFQLVMQILGLGFEKLMSKVTEVLGFDIMQFFEPAKQLIAIYQAEGLTGLAKHGLTQLVGEEGVKALMSVVEIFQAIVSGDWGQVWKIVSGHLENLKEMIFGKIQEFISERVIKAGITWIISLFNPAGAFIKACKAIYDIVMFFIERGKQIMALVNAVIDSVTALADGNISAAAKAIENTLIKGIPVAIGFLASLLGLGNVSEKVQEIIQSARALIDRALDAIFKSKPVQLVIGFAKKLIEKIQKVVKRGIDKAKGALGLSAADKARVDEAETITEDLVTHDGSHHTLAYESLGTSTKLTVRSTPQPIDTFLATASHSVSELAEPEKSEKKRVLDQATLIVELIRNLTEKTAEPTANNSQKNDHVKLITANNQLARHVRALLDVTSVVLPPTVLPPFANAVKAKSIRAKFVSRATPEGETANKHKGVLYGWDRIQKDLRIRENWVKMHLLHHRLGGKATDSNLTPAKSSINQLFYQELEKPALATIESGKNAIWYSVDIEYYSGKEIENYISHISASYGLHDRDKNWAATNPIKEWSMTVEPPRFGAEEVVQKSQSISLNEAGQKLLGRWSFDGRKLDNEFIAMLIEERNHHQITGEREVRELYSSLTDLAMRLERRYPKSKDILVRNVSLLGFARAKAHNVTF